MRIVKQLRADLARLVFRELLEDKVARRIQLEMRRYGPMGEWIPGTRHYRAYCWTCGAAIRLEHQEGLGPCSHCRSAAHPGFNGSHSLPEPDPWGENAVRILEM